MLDFIENNPQLPAKYSVIWLHGLGADGHDFEPIVPQLNLPKELAVRFIFPHAPVRTITINNNMPMRAWYDVFALTLNAPEDEPGIKANQTLIEKLIHQEHQRGTAYKNIFLAGFSQGGAMALYTGLLFPEKLAGIIALSTYLPLQKNFLEAVKSVNKDTPIFMAHGELDTMLPLVLGDMTKQFLQHQFYNIDWHTYPMDHGVCQEEIANIRSWLVRICT